MKFFWDGGENFPSIKDVQKELINRQVDFKIAESNRNGCIRIIAELEEEEYKEINQKIYA